MTGVISLAAIGWALHTDAHSQDIIIPSSLFVVPLGVVFTGLGAGVGALAAPERWSRPLQLREATNSSQIRGLQLGNLCTSLESDLSSGSPANLALTVRSAR